MAFVGPLLKPVRVSEDNFIYREGEPSEGIFFLVSGEAAFVLPDLNDHPFILIEEGLFFGEMEFALSDEPTSCQGLRKLSVKALSDCDLLLFSEANLYKADAEFGDLVEELFHSSLLRLQKALAL